MIGLALLVIGLLATKPLLDKPKRSDFPEPDITVIHTSVTQTYFKPRD